MHNGKISPFCACAAVKHSMYRSLSSCCIAPPQAAVCYYHMNSFSKAYSVLERAVEQARLADAKDLECIAVSNMAVIEHGMLRSKAAIDKSMEALTLVNELPLTHPEL